MSEESRNEHGEKFFADESERLDNGDGSVRENVERLIASGQELIGAELEWAKLKASLMAVGVRNLLFFGTLAIIFLFAALTTLFIGIIIALAPIVGAAFATFIVGGVALIAALLLGLAARRAVRLIDPRSKPS